MRGMGEVEYAGFWVRLAAIMLDSIILTIAYLLIAICGFGLMMVVEPISSSLAGLIAIGLFLIIILGSIAYYPFFLITKGATPGKLILGLVVVDSNYQYPLSIGSALLREILGREIVDGITMGLGNLLIIFDSKKQSLHDRIGGTYVVYERSLPKNKEKVEAIKK